MLRDKPLFPLPVEPKEAFKRLILSLNTSVVLSFLSCLAEKTQGKNVGTTLRYSPKPNDFIFLDPPYDSEFSTYAQNIFDMRDQERLASYLLENCQAKCMLVIKNTEAIFSLYGQKGLTIKTLNKKHLVSFQDRNNRDAEHLLITNF